jgi:hypothetical protein
MTFSSGRQVLNSMARVFATSILTALGLAVVLAGCAPGAMIDRLPGEMGLPAGAPVRPATPYLYPAVHDMPPPRTTTPMNEEEQVKLEKDLAAVRNRQAHEVTGDPDKKAVSRPKTQPAASRVAKKKREDVIVVPPASVKANP